MPARLVVSLVSSLMVSGSVFAEEIKTSYSISSGQAVVSTVIKKASAQREDMMRSYLFPMLAQNLRTLPMVTGVNFNSQVALETTTTSTYQDYYEVKRKYPVMVTLSLPASVTMMFKVEESYRKCKSPAEKPKPSSSRDSYGRNDSPSTPVGIDCALGAQVYVRGPYAVYGNFASAINVDDLLREKQYLRYDISRESGDKTSMRIEGRFVVESEMFEKSLFRFMDAFNVRLAAPPQVDALAGGQSQAVYSRSNILVGIARVLRVNNEKVVGI